MYIIEKSTGGIVPAAYISAIEAEKYLKRRKFKITWLIDEYGFAPAGAVILQGQKGGTVYNVVKVDTFKDADKESWFTSILCDLSCLSAHDLYLLHCFSGAMVRRVKRVQKK